MTRGDAETAEPVHVQATLRAVEDEVLELALQISLHLQEFEAKDLRLKSYRVISGHASGQRLAEAAAAVTAARATAAEPPPPAKRPGQPSPNPPDRRV